MRSASTFRTITIVCLALYWASATAADDACYVSRCLEKVNECYGEVATEGAEAAAGNLACQALQNRCRNECRTSGIKAQLYIQGRWVTGPYAYIIRQHEDELTSDGSFGHATGRFTGPYTIVMKWPSA